MQPPQPSTLESAQYYSYNKTKSRIDLFDILGHENATPVVGGGRYFSLAYSHFQPGTIVHQEHMDIAYFANATGALRVGTAPVPFNLTQISIP